MKKIYQGKARDMYECDDGNIVMVATDRISMFKPLPFEVKDKGKVLNKMSEFWFEKLRDIMPNHMITTKLEHMPEYFQKEEFKNRCMLVKKLNMFKVECIVRGYITGSCWEKYVNGEEICGIKLEDGLKLSQKLSSPIFTPTTKDDDGDDLNITFEEFEKIVGKEFANKIKEKAIEIYQQAYDYAYAKGIIIADTKMEFGVDENNKLILGDEIFTPDCSRYWLAKDYKLGKKQTNYDREELKTFVKGHLKDKNYEKEIPAEIINKISQKYIDIYKMITGKDLEINQ